MILLLTVTNAELTCLALIVLCSSGPAAAASDSPQKGWLLVWTGPGHKQQVRSSLVAASGAHTAIILGAPSCTVMAWPSKGGGTWSGCVFTHPQVCHGSLATGITNGVLYSCPCAFSLIKAEMYIRVACGTICSVPKKLLACVSCFSAFPR